VPSRPGVASAGPGYGHQQSLRHTLSREFGGSHQAAAQVKEAARGVIRLRISALKAEIDALNARAEDLHGQLNGLMPTLYERRWEVPWPPAAAALLHDPEAYLDLEAAELTVLGVQCHTGRYRGSAPDAK
jgi:hypothetical protein